MNKKLWHILMLLAFDFAMLVLITSANAQALHLGHSGEKIIFIQQQLTEKGCYSGSINGKLGFDTRSAIKSFQKSCGLEASGETNYETLTAMGISSRTAECFALETELLARCIQESKCISYHEMLEKGTEILKKTNGIVTLSSYAANNFPNMNYAEEPSCESYSAALQVLGSFSEQSDGIF